MRRHVPLSLAGALVATALVAGCAMRGVPADRGSFVPQLPAAAAHAVADDGVARLAAVYPPASTSMRLEQPAADPFGAEFVAALRRKGYAVAEYGTGGSARAASAPAPAASAVRLGYVVDALGDPALLQLTLFVDDRSALARAYHLRPDGSAAPAGDWTSRGGPAPGDTP